MSTVAVAALALAGCGSSGSSGSGSADRPFDGKTIHFLVGHSPGGGFDTYARLVAKYLGNELGATVVVENQPGAGGIVALNNLARAKPDGTTIEVAAYDSLLTYLGGVEGVNYDPAKFGYIGRLNSDPRLLLSAGDAIGSIQELAGAAKVRYAGEGPPDTLDPRVVADALNLDNIKYVLGYDGSSAVALAIKRGDADFFSGSYSSNVAAVTSGTLTALARIGSGPAKDLPDVPKLTAVADGDDAVLQAHTKFIDLGRFVATSPGVSSEQLGSLRDAFAAVMKDQDFRNEAGKQELTLSYQSGKELGVAVRSAMQDVPDSYLSILKKAG